MSTTRDRLESEINKFELSELANDLGVARNTIYNWMAKANTPLNYLVALKARGVDVEYIISGERSCAQNIEHARANENQPCADEFIHVPRYDVQASAGNGSLVHDESVVDHLAFKRDWVVRTLGLDPKRLALIDVAGDSMSPTINDGDLILLDTRPEQSRTEGIYVINLCGSLLVKRIRMRLSGVVDVVSDNERYGTETISGEQLTSLQIVGRVVWQGRRV